MATELLSVKDAGHLLGVSRRRAEALITSGALQAQKVGGQWVVTLHAVRRLEHTMWRHAGRPLSQKSAWSSLPEIFSVGPYAVDELDQRRRRLRARACHSLGYVHPSQLEKVARDARVVASGRRAAFHHGVPVDVNDHLDIYVRTSDVEALTSHFGIRSVVAGENIALHVIDDEFWPFSAQQKFVDLWTTWLDLADIGDRAADTVLDRVIGGRVRD